MLPHSAVFQPDVKLEWQRQSDDINFVLFLKIFRLIGFLIGLHNFLYPRTSKLGSRTLISIGCLTRGSHRLLKSKRIYHLPVTTFSWPLTAGLMVNKMITRFDYADSGESKTGSPLSKM